MDDLRIQIVNYKTKAYLLGCLTSLEADLARSSFRYSIAILDNASGDDLSDIAPRFPTMPIEIITSIENKGFGAGHNHLAKAADARYLLVLNPDTKFIEPNTIRRMIADAESEHVQAIGPRLITARGKVQRWDHGELKGIRARFVASLGKSFWRPRTRPTSVAWVSGAVFLIEKNWFDRLDGFDEHFFLYKEEEDLCLRLRRAGGIVIYDPTITVLHHGGVVAKKSEHMKRSYQYFKAKHFGRKKK